MGTANLVVPGVGSSRKIAEYFEAQLRAAFGPGCSLHTFDYNGQTPLRDLADAFRDKFLGWFRASRRVTTLMLQIADLLRKHASLNIIAASHGAVLTLHALRSLASVTPDLTRRITVHSFGGAALIPQHCADYTLARCVNHYFERDWIHIMHYRYRIFRTRAFLDRTIKFGERGSTYFVYVTSAGRMPPECDDGRKGHVCYGGLIKAAVKCTRSAAYGYALRTADFLRTLDVMLKQH